MKIMRSGIMAALAVWSSAAAAARLQDGDLTLEVQTRGGEAYYCIRLGGETIIEPSRLGFVADWGDMSQGLEITGEEHFRFEDEYSLSTIKKSHVKVSASRMRVAFENASGKFSVLFHVSGSDVAFRYEIPREGKNGRTGAVRVMDEKTSFRFPDATRAWIAPQAEPMTGWKRSKPSYEEEYLVDAPLPVKSPFARGWTFPALFKTPAAWVLLGETGTDGNYCACRLGEFSGCEAKIEFPMPEEGNGNGTIEPAFALPGATPWRTITVGKTLKPIVQTTIAWDVVASKYGERGTANSKLETANGRAAWSWIVWMEESMNWADQTAYIDFAAAMGWEYILVDAGWDQCDIGYERMPELVEYAASKGIGVFLWYSSSGWWNDIVQSPVNVMCDPIRRRREMKWLASMGVKGIKVDFWGGDKQEMMRLYEQVLFDAYESGLMVIFHGCTMPRGWERMYPNFVGAEAVLASENRYFDKHFCDMAGVNASLHPFIRNSLGAMEYGGVFLNTHMHRDNKSRHERGTTVAFELATAILFQNPIQNFALAPNNLSDAPAEAIEFMKNVPTVWDETRFLAGYPGSYVALARRSGDVWYVAAAAAKEVDLELDLSFIGKGVVKIHLAANDGWVCSGNGERETGRGKSDNLEIRQSDNLREEWVDFAYRLAKPVLSAMAQGRLHEEFSLEKGTLELSPTWDGRDRRVAHMEAFARLMAGIAPWLALPDDGTVESAKRAELRALALQCYKNAVDPSSPDYLGWRAGGQTMVDAAYLVESFFRAWDALWVPLDETTKQRYIAEITGLRRYLPPYQNWLLFAAMEECFLLRAGADADEYRIRLGLYKAEEWYVGDGWYSDGPSFAFDWYNAYVIHPMYLECLDELCRARKWIVPYESPSGGKRRNAGERRGDVLKRMQRFGVISERLVSPEGTYPVFGRSATYRMAVFQPLALLALRKELPGELSEGQVREAMDAVRRNMFSDSRNFNKGGFLTLGFNGPHPGLADRYTNNGSLYMTSLFLLPLGLGADDSFWTAPAEPWTAKKAWSGEAFPKDHKWPINKQPLYWE